MSDRTPYYQDDAVTIYHGRCEDVLPTLADGAFEIVVTSPPYNMGITPGGNGRGMYRHSTQKATRFRDGYDGDSDAIDPDEYAAFHRWALREMWRVTSRAVFWNHRPRVMHGRLVDPLDGDYGGLVLRQRIILDRGTGIDINLNQFCTRGEYLLLFPHDGFRLVDHSASGMGDVWRVGRELKVDHPAPFPVAVPARCIAATGAMTVLDPFMGSGTTLRAAKDAGVHAVGIEQSERFCEMAARRMDQGALTFEVRP